MRIFTGWKALLVALLVFLGIIALIVIAVSALVAVLPILLVIALIFIAYLAVKRIFLGKMHYEGPGKKKGAASLKKGRVVDVKDYKIKK